MKKIFLIAVLSLFAQALWMPKGSAQDVWAASYAGKDIYVVTETLSKERIPGVTSTVYTGMVKFVRGGDFLTMEKYAYKGSEDGLYLSINDGSFIRLGGDYDGFPESVAHYMAIYETMMEALRENGK